MRFNIFVRFKNDSSQYCQWPIMETGREYHVGYFAERYPTPYEKEDVGPAIAWIFSHLHDVAQVEVKQEPDYDQM